MSFYLFLNKIDYIIDLWLFYKQESIKKIIPDTFLNFFYRVTFLIVPYLYLFNKPDYTIYFAAGISTVAILKWLFGRTYPENDKCIESKWDFFKNSITEVGKLAFPSGHTFGTLIAALMFNNILTWGLFSIVVLSLFFRRGHWFSDIVFGALLTIPFYILSIYIGGIQLFNINEILEIIKPISQVTGIVSGIKSLWGVIVSVTSLL